MAAIRTVISVLASVVCLAAAPRALAHNGEPPPLPPRPPRMVQLDTTRVYPLRWSWLHWWEANRDLYLDHPLQGHVDQDNDDEALDRLRADAIDALRTTTESDLATLRGAAAIALGRIGGPAELELLRRIAEHDTAVDVRVSAIIAIGLLRSDGGDAVLLDIEYASPYLKTVGVNSIGLSSRVSDQARDGLRRLVADRSPPLSIAAGRAFSRHADPDDAERIRQLIAQTKSPWLASELILAAPRVDDEQLNGLLCDILLATDRAKSLPVWRELDDIDRAKRTGWEQNTTGDTSGLRERFEQVHERFTQLEPLPQGLDVDDFRPRRPPLVVGVERIYIARLRASAAIALGRIDDQQSVDALVRLLGEREDEWNQLPRGFAAISLGQLRAREGAQPLIELVQPRAPTRAKTQEELGSPTRGMAAIALGLYLRPDPAHPVQGEPFAAVEVTQLLRDRVRDEREKQEVRAACALALGLSLGTDNLEVLAAVSPTIDLKRDEVLLGYVMLARGMLGDETILRPAARFLDVRNDKTDISGLLSRRAVVLALGVLRSREAVPVLTDAWHLNYYANREVILALSLTGARFAAVDVLDRLKHSGDAQERAFMATLLGELLDDRRPSPMAGVTAGTNYTIRNPQRMALQRFANRFLFDYLIPSFDQEWY